MSPCAAAALLQIKSWRHARQPCTTDVGLQALFQTCTYLSYNLPKHNAIREDLIQHTALVMNEGAMKQTDNHTALVIDEGAMKQTDNQTEVSHRPWSSSSLPAIPPELSCNSVWVSVSLSVNFWLPHQTHLTTLEAQLLGGSVIAKCAGPWWQDTQAQTSCRAARAYQAKVPHAVM